NFEAGERKHEPRAGQSEAGADREHEKRERREHLCEARRRHRAIALENDAEAGVAHEEAEITTSARPVSRNALENAYSFRFGRGFPRMAVDELEARARLERCAQPLREAAAGEAARAIGARQRLAAQSQVLQEPLAARIAQGEHFHL